MQIASRDVVALAVSLGWCGAAIGGGEIVRKVRGYGGEFTRKLVHVSIGVWIVPTLLLFETWYMAAILPALAIVGNLVSKRFHILGGIERDNLKDLGTVYFPVSFLFCIAAFFNHPAAAASGVIAMALGDASAAIAGKAFGRHKYTLFGARKSLEGSAAMLVVSFVSVFATLLVFKTPPESAAAVAGILAVVATVLEAAGKNGLDNLTVPVVCSTLAFLLLKSFAGAAP